MELDRALIEISQIRAQVARTEIFRGYRWLTVGFSGAVALITAALQWYFIDEPLAMLTRYVGLWITAAACSMAATGIGMLAHLRCSDSVLSLEHTRSALELFLPCVAVGAVVTLAITLRATYAAWMLPGLWSLVFSLGIFASGRLLPRALALVAVYYFACGSLLLVPPSDANTLAPWIMGLVFGVGQLLAAGILYITLERPDGHQT